MRSYLVIAAVAAAIVAATVASVILFLPDYTIAEDRLAIDGASGSSAIPDSWVSYTATNETRHAYNPTGYDCTLTISQNITDEDRRVIQTTIDCASTIATHTSRIVQDGQSVDVKSVFDEYEFVLEDLPTCSWDILHIDGHDSSPNQTGIIFVESDCWIFDKGLIGLPEE